MEHLCHLTRVVNRPAADLVSHCLTLPAVFLMYLQRSTSKAFGYVIVSRNAGNRFSTDFQEAAILGNSDRTSYTQILKSKAWGYRVNPFPRAYTPFWSQDLYIGCTIRSFTNPHGCLPVASYKILPTKHRNACSLSGGCQDQLQVFYRCLILNDLGMFTLLIRTTTHHILE